MKKSRDEYHLLDKEFTQPHTLRTFWIFVGIVFLFVAVAIASFYYFNDGDHTQSLADITEIDIASDNKLITNVPSGTVIEPPSLAYDQLAARGESVERIEPGAGDPGAATELPPTTALPPEAREPVSPEALANGVPGSLTVIDVDGQPVGPVIVIDPSASIDQDIQFSLRPELAEAFRFTESFRMPLDDMEVVTMTDGSYALQLNEDQTRYLATYLFAATE